MVPSVPDTQEHAEIPPTGDDSGAAPEYARPDLIEPPAPVALGSSQPNALVGDILCDDDHSYSFPLVDDVDHSDIDDENATHSSSSTTSHPTTTTTMMTKLMQLSLSFVEVSYQLVPPQFLPMNH